MNSNELFSITNIKNTKEFNKSKKKKSQKEYYEENDSPKEILKLVGMNPKAFGEKMQKIIIELLVLEKSNNSGYDARIDNKKIEIKSSRFWVNNGDFKWQHIMEEHTYDYLIFIGVNFTKFDVYLISKNRFVELKIITTSRGRYIVREQGGAENQGLWANRNDIVQYLQKINTIEDFQKYIKSNDT